jgi:hypothetical protein
VSPVITAQLALSVIGLIVWGYGTRLDDPRVGWAGVALIAVAALLRFAKRRSPPEG